MFLSTRWNQSNTFCSWFGYDWELYYNFVIYHVITQRYQFHRQKSIIYLLLLLCGDIETYPGPAGFFTEINNFCRTKGLKLFHLNIRGLQGNFNEIRDVLLNTKIDIFGLTEIFLESNSLMGFDVPGYSFIQRDQVSGTRGGVGMECTFKMVSTTSQGETRFGWSCNRGDLDSGNHTNEINLSLFHNLQTTWLIKAPLQGFFNQPNSQIGSCN